MDCPNCEKEPVGVLHSFRLSGATVKEKFNGYFRCQHCGTLLKQVTNSGLFGGFKAGYWWRIFLVMAVFFGGIYGALFLNISGQMNLPIFFGCLAILMMVYMIVLDELKRRFWIIREADKQEDQKHEPRMGLPGWLVLIFFLSVMVGGLIVVDQYEGLADFGDWYQWQQIIAMVLCILLIVGGAAGIFSYFAETEKAEGIWQ